METLADETKRLARELKTQRHVRAVCLLGSVARSEHDALSDVDILAVIDDDASFQGHLLRDLLPRRIAGRRLQLRVLTTSRLGQMAESHTMFAAHIALEGRPVFDRGRDLRRVRRAFPPGAVVEEPVSPLRHRLSLYQELDWCHGHYLACLADLYAFGRAGAMLALAQRGIFDFRRSGPLERFSEEFPTHYGAARRVLALEPFYLSERRSVATPLPFPHRGSHLETEQARDACRHVLSVAA